MEVNTKIMVIWDEMMSNFVDRHLLQNKTDLCMQQHPYESCSTALWSRNTHSYIFPTTQKPNKKRAQQSEWGSLVEECNTNIYICQQGNITFNLFHDYKGWNMCISGGFTHFKICHIQTSKENDFTFKLWKMELWLWRAMLY